MAKKVIKIVVPNRAKPNTISPGLTLGKRMYGNGGKLRACPKKRST